VRALALLAAVVVLIGLMGAAFVVDEAEQAIVTQLGRPVGEPIDTPGLKVKLPFIQQVHRFDKRFLEWDGEANQLPTRDKRFIWVDTYARWRISDPLLFFQRLQDERGAQTRLDDILDGETRNSIAKHDLVEVVRTSNREPESDQEQLADEQATLAPIAFGREKIRREILAAAQKRTADLGIEILDVQLKRINYVSDVQEKVFDRMIAERERIAARYRSEGEGEALRIDGERERELKRIRSEAYREAQEIRGRADASATEIYAAAYDRNREARDFYAFVATMDTLRSTADADTVLVLGTDGELYRYLESDTGQ
jgi:membrane protease subunit HflC